MLAAPHQRMHLPTNLVDPRYELQFTERLNDGGYSWVLGAVAVRNALVAPERVTEPLAVKIQHFDPRLPSDREAVTRRTEKEAGFMRRLKHPNILPLYDYGVNDAYAYTYMVMPRGTFELEDFLSANPTVTWQHLSYLRQAANALDHTHRQDVVHRDVKPRNVLIMRDGRLALTDFGTAALANPVTPDEIADAENLEGTPDYCAPEQYEPCGSVPATDQYALAVMAYRMFSKGQLPFTGTAIAVALHHKQTPVPAIRDVTGEESSFEQLAAEKVLIRALSKNPAGRYETVSAFVDALDTAMLAAVEAYVREGTLYASAGNRKDAMESFANAIRLGPYNIQTRYEYAEALSGMGRHAEMETQLQAVMSLTPRTGKEYALVGFARAAVGHHAAALECFDEAERNGYPERDLRRHRISSYEELGDVWMYSGRAETAESFYGHASDYLGKLLGTFGFLNMDNNLRQQKRRVKEKIKAATTQKFAQQYQATQSFR